jgi:hypothetical protein
MKTYSGVDVYSIHDLCKNTMEMIYFHLYLTLFYCFRHKPVNGTFTTSIHKVTTLLDCKDGGNLFLRNTYINVQDSTVLEPTRSQPEITLQFYIPFLTEKRCIFFIKYTKKVTGNEVKASRFSNALSKRQGRNFIFTLKEHKRSLKIFLN